MADDAEKDEGNEDINDAEEEEIFDLVDSEDGTDTKAIENEKGPIVKKPENEASPPDQIKEPKPENKDVDSGSKNEKESQFIKTGIAGFDSLITQGIPRGSQILISGGPGTMKTTFCMNVLVNAAKRGLTALYLSFEEKEENLIRNTRPFGWNTEDLIAEGKLVLRNLDPFKMSRSVETLLAQARGELLIEVNEARNLIPENITPDVVVIDSLSAISAGFFGKEEGYRAYMSQIFDTFRNLGMTSFMITEIEHSTTKYSKSGVEEFLADAVFAFYNMRQGSQRLNATEVIKLRGSEHQKKIVPFKALANQGIVVYPTEEIFMDK